MSYSRLKQKGVHHICLRVPNLKETVHFYQNAMDARLVTEWGKEGTDDHAFILDLGEGDFLEIFSSNVKWDIGSWQHVAVWTDDIETSMERAISFGAEKISQPARSDIPTRSGQIVRMKYGFVRAPGGEIVEFIEDIPNS